MSTSPDSSIRYRPDAASLEGTHIHRLMERAGAETPEALHAWSVEDVARFWDTVNEDLDIAWFEPYRQTLDLEGGFPWAKWFVGGKTNITLGCLQRHVDAGRGDEPAMIGEADDGTIDRWTYTRLHDEVGRAAGLLRELGVEVGDRVGIYMPMVPEVVVALFACFQVGAVAVPVFSAFGSDGLAIRLQDAEAKVLFTADGGNRRGKPRAIKPAADTALADCPAVQHTIVLRRTGQDVAFQSGRDRWWDEAVSSREPDRTIAVLDAEAPCMILYTSGTTGAPKGTVHTHAGVLMQTSKELAYAFDVQPGCTFFWLTDIGWMMGPWEMIGVTNLGGTFVVFEGAPNWPEPDRLFAMVARHGITHLGVAPTAVRLLRRAGDGLADAHDLSTLRILGSTGEPWDEESWTWFHEQAGRGECPIINISGGTEMMGCLLSPLPTSPLKPCTLGGPGLGMDVDVFDEDGKSVRGAVGHLVLKQPAPSLTKSFLRADARYLATYFERFGDGVWYHGDWALVDEEGFWFLHGRSDDTINVAGKRVGPAEVEAAVVAHADASEAAAIGVPDDLKGADVVVFVVVRPGVEETEALREALMALVVAQLGKTLKPRELRFVDALPKTRSAKIVRGAIKRRWLGEPVGDLASVENPEAVDAVVRSR